MIREITKLELKEKNYTIFPEIDFTTEEQPAIRYINILTYIKIENYLIPFRKQYSYMTKLNYWELMKYVDSLMSEINKLRINFNPDIISGIYKIID